MWSCLCLTMDVPCAVVELLVSNCGCAKQCCSATCVVTLTRHSSKVPDSQTSYQSSTDALTTSALSPIIITITFSVFTSSSSCHDCTISTTHFAIDRTSSTSNKSREHISKAEKTKGKKKQPVSLGHRKWASARKREKEEKPRSPL